MKILIIVPRYVDKPFSYYNFPLGLGYIAAIAKRDGHKVAGLNLNETNDSIEIALEKAIVKKILMLLPQVHFQVGLIK